MMKLLFHLATSLQLLCISSVPLLILFLFIFTSKRRTIPSSTTINNSTNKQQLVRSYPIIGSALDIFLNKERFVQWTCEMVNSTPNLTFSLDLFLGDKTIITSNSANVRHALITDFASYGKGEYFKTLIGDVFGDIFFVLDGEKCKAQRQLIGREINSRYLRESTETIVDEEVFGRLIPVLENAAETESEVDLQNIMERFSFDVLCRVAFGYDPEYLSPSLPESGFASEFATASKISVDRIFCASPYIWKVKRALNIGSEKRLKTAIDYVKGFALDLVREKKKRQLTKDDGPSTTNDNFLTRLLSQPELPEEVLADMMLGAILAGGDTTSSALTWFFWLLSGHPEVEREILNETMSVGPDDMKKMVYTHASLCEGMRLHPPVPVDYRVAFRDDVLPDGTRLKKGTRLMFHVYAMGRVEAVWGPDWAEFKPTRWLEEELGDKSCRRFVGRDPSVYPVFWVGPRVCLGKDMAFLQMKKTVSAVLQRFKVVPTVRGGGEPVHELEFTTRMKGGFKVRIQERND